MSRTVTLWVKFDHRRSWCNLLLRSILNLVQSQTKVRELVSLCEVVRPSTLVPSCFAIWPWRGAEFNLDLGRDIFLWNNWFNGILLPCDTKFRQLIIGHRSCWLQNMKTTIGLQLGLRANSDSWPEIIMTSADVLRKMWYKSQKGGGAILEIWRCEEPPHFELLQGYMARRQPMSPYSMSPYSKSPWSKAPTVAWVKLNSQ